ncbi:DUF4136 domain-containing protein [Tsuneonella sp. HG249]
MTKAFLPLAVLSALSLAAPAAAAEVSVTRFHTAESLGAAAPGPIAVRAGAGLEPGSLETQIWLDAVATALTRQGFTVVPDAARVAEVSLDQQMIDSGRDRSNTGVSVGVGVGSGGGWGYRRRSGVDLGVGVGFNLGGGRSAEALDTRLSVSIENAGGVHAWEGRAEAAPRTRSKDAQTRALAKEMADRLFSGFPGESGATIGAR